MSTQFYDNQVTTVDYQILFTKRDKEALLKRETTTVTKAMTGNGFASWKIAEFVYENLEKPPQWEQQDYNNFTEEFGGKRRLKKENLEFLQLDYQIVSTFDRKPSIDQAVLLREIASAIKNKP